MGYTIPKRPVELSWKSTADCGKGCFAAENIELNNVIGRLHGRLVEESTGAPVSGPTFLFKSIGGIYDAKYSKDCLLKYANHSCKVSHLFNCPVILYRNIVFLIAEHDRHSTTRRYSCASINHFHSS